MKSLKIGIGLLFLIVLGFQLPVSGYAPMGESQTIAPKSPQGDTIRMRWLVSKKEYSREFTFYGEAGATYKVIWGDGESSTTTIGRTSYIGRFHHTYTVPQFYDVLLFGVTPEKE